MSNSFKVESKKRTLKVWQVFDKMMTTLSDIRNLTTDLNSGSCEVTTTSISSYRDQYVIVIFPSLYDNLIKFL